MKRVVLLTPAVEEQLDRLLSTLSGLDVRVVRDIESLAVEAADSTSAVIIGFGTGVIVPGDILSGRVSPAYNFHAASPAFPGRDPHHFAIYHGAAEYGATAHVMTERVDEGAIVGVRRFPIPPGIRPSRLLAMANEAMFDLFDELAREMASGERLATLTNERWGDLRTTRRLFRQLCEISPLIDQEEFQRRVRAFQSDGYRNLVTTLHGHIFRIDPDATPENFGGDPEFTEAGYRRLVRLALSSGYRFCSYTDPRVDRTVLWRHDVDLSIHRALRLAQIEVEEGVRSTFFVNPNCAYYNILEPAVAERVREILAMGHELGLHFDGDAFPDIGSSSDALERALQYGRDLLQRFFGVPVNAVSWHNPDTGNLLSHDEDVISGMVNCYGAGLRSTTVYVSDSNGYWRFEPAGDVIRAGHPRLHVLTHPDWWTPEPMPPRKRVERCLLGRARSISGEYDRHLRSHGRRNLNGD